MLNRDNLSRLEAFANHRRIAFGLARRPGKGPDWACRGVHPNCTYFGMYVQWV